MPPILKSRIYPAADSESVLINEVIYLVIPPQAVHHMDASMFLDICDDKRPLVAYV